MATYTIQELRVMWNKKSKKPMESIEHNIQATCFEWFSAVYPQYYDLFWSIPNGGYRSKRTAAIMKQEGQKAGVPDTFFAYPAKGFHGLFIEFKKSRIGKSGKRIDKGHLSDNQERVIASLQRVGYKVEVCYSFDQFRQIMKEYLSVDMQSLHGQAGDI